LTTNSALNIDEAPATKRCDV